jgi:hypothetical protein
LVTRIFARESLRFPAFAKAVAARRGPEQKANDELSPKNFPNAQSATVQCAAT